MKKLNKLILVLASLFITTFTGCNNKKDNNQVNNSFEIKVKEFNKHGNVILDTTFESLKGKNIEIMDLITVDIGNNSYDIPVGSEYSDVDSQNMICRFDLEDSKVILAINGGNFATTTNMATKETITDDPGYKWNVSIDKVTFSLKTKYGYKDEYTIRHLERSNNREDYTNLNDAKYANCRVINTTNIKDNILYRGTTPIDNDMNRATYAMQFLNDANIKSIINLTNTYNEMIDCELYNDSYYASCTIGNILMDYEFTKSSFASKVRECVEFINENDGPYYIHCKEGKDRTGILLAIIECYFGASYQEIVEDYMETYTNFYKVEKNSEAYNIIVKTNLEKVLNEIYNVIDIKEANLESEAKEYLLEAGLSLEDLASFDAKLKASL